MRDLPGSNGILKAGHRGQNPADPITNSTMTDTNHIQDPVAPKHERFLLTVERLLSDAETSAEVVSECQSLLETPGYQRTQSQARRDASATLLELVQSDVSTKRTREAKQLLMAVSGGDI